MATYLNKNKNTKPYYPLNKVNVFSGRNPEDFSFTNHFFERWNERVLNPHFNKKSELEQYIKDIYSPKLIKHISGDYYFLDNLIITATLDNKDDSIVFVTVYGSIEDNPILYNILVTQGAKGVRKAHKKYGKINILPN